MINNTSRLNSFLEGSKPSAIYKVIDRISEKKSNGENIISLCAGEPDFDTPVHISSAAIQAINSGFTRYTQVEGLKELRQAVENKFEIENNISTSWENTIVCTGGKKVLFNALAATLNEYDEVIIPSPYWVSYPEMVGVCGGNSVFVLGNIENDFKLTATALNNAITPRTKWLILNSPSNPTGAVYTKEELIELAIVLRKHPQVMVLSDDIYEHLIYDGEIFYTIAQVAPDLKDRILTMNGVSKAYAMTGWRIGFGTGPKWLITAMIKLQSQQTSGACSISQYAALAALQGPKDFISVSKSHFTQRRDLAVDIINSTQGLKCKKPSGAFYLFVDCSGLIGKITPSRQTLKTDEDIAYALLEEINVAVVHGSAFGLGPYLRIAYALDDESLKEACYSIKNFCESLI